MFGIIKKIKQITGDEPIERKHLGQYSYSSKFKADESDILFYDEERINTDVYLYFYSTNSAKIIIESRIWTKSYHLIQLPYMSGEYESFQVKDDHKQEFIIGINTNSTLICLKGKGIGTKFFNK